MAFIDYLRSSHEQQRGSAFGPASGSFHPSDLLQHTMPPALQAPVPSQGPPVNLARSAHPPLYSSYVICPHCHFQQQVLNNYSVNPVCSNCNHSFFLPPPPIGHSLVQHSPSTIPQPLTGELAARPPHNPQPGPSNNHQSGPQLAAVGGQRSRQLPSQDTSDGSSSGSTEDRFMMTSIVDVVETLFTDSSDHLLSLNSSVNTSANSTSLLRTISTSDTGMAQNQPTSPPTSSVSLGPNRAAGVVHQANILSSPSSSVKLLCKCGNNKVAMCMECQEYLCSSCITDHKQTCKESEILIYPPSDSSDSANDQTSPICTTPLQSSAVEIELVQTVELRDDGESCTSHPDERLSHFCFICAKLVCTACTSSTEHAHHKCINLQEAYTHIQPGIDDMMRKTQVELDLLQYSLADVTSMSDNVDEKQQEAISKAKQIFQAHREALAAREKEVIAQTNDIASKRMSSLKSKQERIVSSLDLLKRLLQNGEKAVQSGKKPQMVVSHHKLSSELNRCD